MPSSIVSGWSFSVNKFQFFDANRYTLEFGPPKNNISWWFQSIESCWKWNRCIFMPSSIVTVSCFSVITVPNHRERWIFSDLLEIPAVIFKWKNFTLFSKQFTQLHNPYLNISNNSSFPSKNQSFKNFMIFGHSIEPISSTKPNVNIGDKSNIANVRVRHQISLLCPVQSYPIPAFR